MELSDKLIKIVSDYNRVQYDIALRKLAALTNIVHERKKLNLVEKGISSSVLASIYELRQSEISALSEINCDILTDKKPNPPIA